MSNNNGVEPNSQAMLLSSVPAEVAAENQLRVSVENTRDELKLQLLLNSNLLIPAGDLLDSHALWQLMREDPETLNLLLEKTGDGMTTMVVSHGTDPRESLDDRVRNWLLGADRKRENVPSAVPHPGIPAAVVEAWRGSPTTLTFDSYVVRSNLPELSRRRADLERIFANATSIVTPLDRHERFRNLAFDWLNERVGHGHRSAAEDELWNWYFRGDRMSRTALSKNPKIWGDEAFRSKLIALRQACATDGETRHRFVALPPPGHPVLLKVVANLFEEDPPDWQLDLDQLDFDDILRIRQDTHFAKALRRMSLPVSELAEEADLERFLKTGWRDLLLAAARPLDSGRRIIKKANDASVEQAVGAATEAGSALLKAGVGTLVAGTSGAVLLGKLAGASPLLAASPLAVALVLLGVGCQLHVRSAPKRRAAKHIANGVIGALSAGAGATAPPRNIPVLPGKDST